MEVYVVILDIRGDKTLSAFKGTLAHVQREAVLMVDPDFSDWEEHGCWNRNKKGQTSWEFDGGWGDVELTLWKVKVIQA